MKVVMINDCAYVSQTLAQQMRKTGINVELRLRTRSFFDKTLGIAGKVITSKGDIYHCAYLLNDCWLARKFMKRPLLGHAHGSDIRGINGKWGKIIKKNLMSCDKILVATPDIYNVAKEFNNTTEYFPTPIDIELFSPVNDMKIDRKRALYCLKYFDSFPVDLGKEILNRGYEIIVMKPGSFNYKEMPNIYRKYDLFIDQQTLPIITKMCLEAMSCGIPVVTHDGRFRMNGDMNRKFVIENHDSKKLSKRLIDIYRTLVNVDI